MRIGKKKQGQGLTPVQVESLGAVASSDLPRFDSAAVEILHQLDAANARRLGLESGRDVRGTSAARTLPPPNNMGGKSPEGRGTPESDTVKLVLEDGIIKEVPKRRGWGGDAAFIDWVNFTVGEETFLSSKTGPVIRVERIGDEYKEIRQFDSHDVPVTDAQIMGRISRDLEKVFGFGITSQREKGANFYRQSWELGNGWGMVCNGGQHQTILVMLNGSGCAAAKSGWEQRLIDFLESSNRPRITRMDLAFDDFGGSVYTVDKADQDHTDGLYNCGGRNPDCEHRGNWKNPNGKGRTLNIGNRKNGKFCRVYEKGRQLGDEKSEWVRVEVEFKSVDRVLPFDALIRPGEYLAAAYPAFAWININQERIFTTQAVVTKTVEKAVKWIKHQCGASISTMVDLFGVDEFLKKVVRPGNPKWSDVPNYLLGVDGIHVERDNPPINLNAAASDW